jgi:ketosteroid isomerase-like protein
MPQRIVDVVQRFHPPETLDLTEVFRDEAALADFRATREELIDDEFEARFDPELVGMFSDFAMRRGMDGLLDGWREWLGSFESYFFKAEELIVVDDQRVLLTAQGKGRQKGTDVDVTIDMASVWTLRDGKILRLEQYFDRRKAEQAAGLREPSP